MKYILIGRITGTHGLRGELKLKSSFLYKDRVLRKGFDFYIGDNKKKVTLFNYRFHNGFILLTFDGFLDINLVESFRNNDVYVLREDIDLKDNEFLLEDYINLDAYFNEQYLGKIVDVVDCGHGNYVFDIMGDKEILIPLKDMFIDKVLANDKVYFKEVEGLIDAN